MIVYDSIHGNFLKCIGTMILLFMIMWCDFMIGLVGGWNELSAILLFLEFGTRGRSKLAYEFDLTVLCSVDTNGAGLAQLMSVGTWRSWLNLLLKKNDCFVNTNGAGLTQLMSVWWFILFLEFGTRGKSKLALNFDLTVRCSVNTKGAVLAADIRLVIHFIFGIRYTW